MSDPNELDEAGESTDRLGDESDELDDASADDTASEDDTAELPANVVDEAERLTRLERQAADENEAAAYRSRRTELLEPHEFTARIRDDGDAVLVLHPEEWHDDDADVIRTDRVEDLSRGIEIPLEGAGDPDDWDAVDAHNRNLVAQVRADHGDVHGENARLLADFAGNHYAKSIESLTAAELAEFLTEYVVRNAWPSAAQQDALEESIELVYEAAGESVPDYRLQ